MNKAAELIDRIEMLMRTMVAPEWVQQTLLDCKDELEQSDITMSVLEEYMKLYADNQRLTKELDILLNGIDGCAEQASLCDIVAQVRKQGLIVDDKVKAAHDIFIFFNELASKQVALPPDFNVSIEDVLDYDRKVKAASEVENEAEKHEAISGENNE